MCQVKENVVDNLGTKVTVRTASYDGKNWYEIADDVDSIMVYVCVSTPQNIVIPSQVSYENENYTVVGIRQLAFQGCRALESVEIPQSIKRIGIEAFVGCSALKKIVVKGDVEVSPIKESFSGLQDVDLEWYGSEEGLAEFLYNIVLSDKNSEDYVNRKSNDLGSWTIHVRKELNPESLRKELSFNWNIVADLMNTNS